MENKQLKIDLDNFFRVAMSCLCHCYDNTEGLYPDNCSCDSRENIHEAIKALIEEHKRLIKKYQL
jgi:hypothetical protein